MKYNENKIRKIEVKSFMKFYLQHCKHELSINDETDFEIFGEDFLLSFLQNSKRFQIFGVDFVKDFKIDIADEKIFYKVCEDIYKNPQEYVLSKHEEDIDEFVRRLWTKDVDGVEKNMVDFYIGVDMATDKPKKEEDEGKSFKSQDHFRNGDDWLLDT